MNLAPFLGLSNPQCSHSVAMKTWLCCLDSLNLDFVICKLGIMILRVFIRFKILDKYSFLYILYNLKYSAS